MIGARSIARCVGMVVVDVVSARVAIIDVRKNTLRSLLGLDGPAAAASAKNGVWLNHGWMLFHLLSRLSLPSAVALATLSAVVSSVSKLSLLLPQLVLH